MGLRYEFSFLNELSRHSLWGGPFCEYSFPNGQCLVVGAWMGGSLFDLSTCTYFPQLCSFEELGEWVSFQPKIVRLAIKKQTTYCITGNIHVQKVLRISGISGDS